MEVLALIPARGGSKSIPRKNLLLLAGRPLIAYSIEQALAARRITRTIVSTEDEEIAETARRYGAEVPFRRPAEFAGDLSPDIDVFRHALSWLAENEGYQPELVVHLRPTGPIRRVELIDQAIDLLRSHPEADALRSVSWPVQSPYKMWRIVDKYLEPLLQVDGLPDTHSMPRQILPEVYWQNGYVDVLRPRTVLEMDSMCGQTVLPLVIQEPIYELDYEENIPALEAALHRFQQNQALAGSPNAPRHPV